MSVAAYAWKVTYDHLDKKRVAVYGPHDITGSQRAELDAMHGDTDGKFRMFDDDGELYYTGYLVGDVESDDAFGPLDDYGTPNAGATEIRYFRPERGVWEQL